MIKNRFSVTKSEPKEFTTPSKVQQQFKDQTDINRIVSRYKKTGALHSTVGDLHNRKAAQFGHFETRDYVEIYQAIQDIRQQFMNLPARVRARFDHNPANVVAFVNDPVNLKESIKMGLIKLQPGLEIDQLGNIIEQQDLVKQADNLKADPEAQPAFKQ